MARDILFKAKRTDNGEWVMGGSIIQFLDDGVRSFYMPQFNEKCICKHDEVTDDILEFQNTRFYKVDGDTICQYTGLTDKNGNKIWENDVVKKHFYTNFEWFANSEEYIGKVEYEDCAWNIVFNKNGNKCVYPIFMAVEHRDAEYFEVIGNIFDNTELLGGSDNG